MIFGNSAKCFLQLLLLHFIFIPSIGLLAQPLPREDEPFDILINEIMADPTPSQGLPECEYIELYNRSALAVNLSGWCLSLGRSDILLPDTVLGPGDFGVILDHDCGCSELIRGKQISVSLPHVANTGQVITLRSISRSVIHSVNFTEELYNDQAKEDGGWSVELIDPSNPCGEENNWHASKDKSGGTPGFTNSVSGQNPDKSPPRLLHASLITDTAVLLHFNETLHYTGLGETSQYSVDGGFYHPATAIPCEPFFDDVILNYQLPFKPGIIYHVSLLDDLSDCAGNHPDEALSASFALTEQAYTADVVFNEILFEAGTKVEFIEIYNRSKKVIELSALNLSLADKYNVIIKTIRLSEHAVSIFPATYKLICKNSDELFERYSNIDQVSVIENRGLFTMPDDGGLLVLADTSGEVIDECIFNTGMHYELYTSTAGISLERISADQLSGDPDNWHSASVSADFSTPGKQNSQYINDESESITLSSDIVSPDGDGIDDEVSLYFHLTEPGWTGDVTVFSLKGHKTRSIISNQLIGTHETLVWNGASDEGYIADPGIYVIHARLFSTSGEIKNFKKVVCVVKK